MRGNQLLGVIVCGGLWLVACTGGGSDEVSATAPEASPLPSPSPADLTAAVPGCPHAPSSARGWGVGSWEIEAAAVGGTVWALVEGGVPVIARHDVKIIWRVTGKGPLTLVAVNGAGMLLRPDDVAAHGGSSWRRPGDEWGSAWSFPKPGCWDLHVERGRTVGDVWLRVS